MSLKGGRSVVLRAPSQDRNIQDDTEIALVSWQGGQWRGDRDRVVVPPSCQGLAAGLARLDLPIFGDRAEMFAKSHLQLHNQQQQHL